MKSSIYLLFSLILLKLTSGILYEKCCHANEQLVNVNETLKCQNVWDNRIKSNLSKNGFVYKNVDGQCVDVQNDTDVKIFSIKNNTITEVKIYETDFIPKCCPLGWVYNQTIHSCIELNYSNTLFQSESFVKVGLKECRVVYDKIVKNPVINKTSYGFPYIENISDIVKSSTYCWDQTVDQVNIVVRICQDDLKICEKIRCIKKCCPDGQSYVNGSKCKDTFIYGVDLHSSKKIDDSESEFAIIHGFQQRVYVLHERKYNFSLDSRGRFHNYAEKTNTFETHYPEEDSYCFEHAYKKNILDGYTFFHKLNPEEVIETKFLVTRWVKVVSCFFLLLTVIVYAILPNMRNLFGKILLCYNVATFLFFLFLIIVQFFLQLSDGLCKIIGFFTIFAGFSSFTWMHIMCIDIWLSFGSPSTLIGSLQKNERKRFIQYSLYGWGFPLACVLIVLSLNKSNILPNQIHPYVGEFNCYLESNFHRPGNYAKLLFFITPIIIQQVVNTTLFIKTVRYCLKIKAEINKMNDTKRKENNHNYNTSQERLGLIIKLAVIMGISFIFETISSIYNFNGNKVTEYIEVTWDTINCLQGVFIFIVFICKKKVMDSLCEKFNLKSRKHSVSSTVTTELSMQTYICKKEKSPAKNMDT